MIQEFEQKTAKNAWQQALGRMITNPQELLELLDLSAEQLGLSQAAAKQFSCRVPREFVAKMQSSDPFDPLLLQVLPSAKEMLAMPGYTADPLGECSVNPVQGLLHKYHGRVLLTVATSCAINCRYCFRRHFPYEDNNPGTKGWSDAIQYVANDTSISEIIFSGGDPLMLKDHQLSELANQFSKIPHVKRLRIHTRLPVVIPARINDELCEWLNELPLQKVMVVHCNHPNEIDDEFGAAMQQLRSTDVTLLNQSVLLKNVNDDAKTLCDLSEKLFKFSVLPYYIHLLDKVSGAAHFDVSKNEAVALIQTVRENLSGFLVPELVTEISGVGSKVRVN